MPQASALAAALLVALPVPALAAGFPVPSPTNSTVPVGIVLVGETGGVPDPLGFFTVTVRDYSNNLIPNAVVTVDFTNTPDVSISSDQSHPGLFVECAPVQKVSAVTDVAGVARFTVTGAVVNHHADGNAAACDANVYADGWWIGSTRVTSPNLDGEVGVSPNDLYLWFCDYGLGTNPCYSDYDFDGFVGSMDLTILLSAMGGRSRDTPALCTPVAGPPAEVVESVGGLKLEKLDCTSGGSPNYDPDFCAGPVSRYTEIVGSINLLAAGFTEDVSLFTGLEATIRVHDYDVSFSAPITDYWRFENPSGCHRSGLTVTAASGTNCLGDGNPVYPSGSSATRVVTWPHPGTGASNSSELWMNQIAIGPATGNSIPADGAYYPVFAFRINHNLACAGCDDKVLFTLESLRFTTLGDTLLDCFSGAPRPEAGNTLHGPGAAKRIVTMRPAAGDPVFVFSDDAPVGVPESLPVSGWWVGSAEPNPSRGLTRLALRLASPARLRAEVFDLAGRLVARLADGEFTAGDHRLEWSGDRMDGGPAGNGLYFVRIGSGAQTETRAVVLRR